MATDGPTPTRCDPEVYSKGTTVGLTHTIASCAMEKWVQKVAKESDQRVDWFFMGGRAVIRALGDLEKVREAIQKLLPEHDELFRKAVANISTEEWATECQPPPVLRW